MLSVEKAESKKSDPFYSWNSLTILTLLFLVGRLKEPRPKRFMHFNGRTDNLIAQFVDVHGIH